MSMIGFGAGIIKTGEYMDPENGHNPGRIL
jgi:hypothetical protein